MQFITILALLFTAVAAVPSGTEASMVEARDIGISVAHRSVGDTICKAACAVTCNSTVLALAQTKCLEICNGACGN
ncbi:hypothetical protein DL98DRAFT_586324 [Cadophora sp. DSE1049]|nr:hypothetical protein DL98DRAFT_586324 [Cadophora sp. DSE1049]